MSDLERALAKFPPSVTSRCYSKLSRTDHACQKYFSVVTSRPYGSAVRFQLTYNCGSTKLQCPKEKKPISSLPPPCCHRKEILFYCPVNACVSPEPKLRNPRHCPSSFPSLTCKPKPECSPLPPTICVAGPCSQPSASESYCRPSAPKILPPPSRVQFCIRYTNEGSSSYPCSNLPKCPGEMC